MGFAPSCAKRSYTVTVSDRVLPPVTQRAQRGEPLDRLRESAERLRARARAESRAAAAARGEGMTGRGGNEDVARGTTGFADQRQDGMAGAAGSTSSTPPPDSIAQPSTDLPTQSSDAEGDALPALALLALIGGIALLAAAVLLLARRATTATKTH